MRRLAALLLAIAAAGACIRKDAAGNHARLLRDDGVLRVVILGDSVARGAGDERGLGIAGALDRQLSHDAVVNLGIDGARTRDVLRALSDRRAQAAVRTADVIVVSIGGNDLYGDSRARLLTALLPEVQQQRVLERVAGVIARLRDLNPSAEVILLGLYNPYRRSARAAWLDRQIDDWDGRLIRRFAASRNLTVVRICDLLDRADRISPLDRFHPGGEGYTAIAARIASSLR